MYGRQLGIFSDSPVLCIAQLKKHAATYCCTGYKKATLEFWDGFTAAEYGTQNENDHYDLKYLATPINPT